MCGCASLHILTCCIGPPFLASEAWLDTSPQPLRSQLYPYKSSYGGMGRRGILASHPDAHSPCGCELFQAVCTLMIASIKPFLPFTVAQPPNSNSISVMFILYSTETLPLLYIKWTPVVSNNMSHDPVMNLWSPPGEQCDHVHSEGCW